MSQGGFSLTTQGPEQTEALAAALAARIPSGALLALRGDLASGKTCFVRGLAARLTPGEAVSSPTFTLVNEYAGEPSIYHLDLYRLTSPAEVFDLGYEDLFAPVDAIVVIEWADRVDSLLPARRLDIRFEHAGGDTRNIVLRDTLPLAAGWRDALHEALA